MKWKNVLCAAALCLSALAVMLIPPFLCRSGEESLPGTRKAHRQLLRVWVMGAPGGGAAWLQKQLTAFERAQPGTQVYLRQVSAEALREEHPSPPDVVLFMPGEITAPEELLLPLTGALQGEEALLRAGRWQGVQYAAPLCWSAWVLAVDGSYDDTPAATPAPTALIGYPPPAPEASPTASPGFPPEKLLTADTPLLSPAGCGLIALRLLTEHPLSLPEEAAALSAGDVYAAFTARRTASAVLTTGQLTAFRSLQAAGRGFPCRILVPREVITDMVWMAGVVRSSPAAAALISHLTGEDAQRALAAQGLFPVSGDMPLYGDGASAQVEAAARRSLSAVNAFLPAEAAAQAAWQVFTGAATVAEALPPLL